VGRQGDILKMRVISNRMDLLVVLFYFLNSSKHTIPTAGNIRPFSFKWTIPPPEI
jgi:hypothetical protein